MSAASPLQTHVSNPAAEQQPKQATEAVLTTMTTAATTTAKEKSKSNAEKAKKKKKDRAKKKAKQASRKTTLKTKVVVRRLPPNLPEDVFMNTVKQWTSDESVDFAYYVPGKLAKSKAKEHVFSRAYFHMKTMEAVIAFHQGFDGHIFLDNRGNESRAVVEFAPFQKIPREHKNADARQGTIDDDQDYLSFLESLKAEENKEAEPKETGDGLSQIERLENRLALVTAQTLAAEQANKPKTTPLLDHLRAQKAAKDALKAKAQASKAIAKASAKKAQAPAKANASTAEGPKKPSRRERGKKKKEEKKAAAAAATAAGGGSAGGPAVAGGDAGTKEPSGKSEKTTSGRANREGGGRSRRKNADKDGKNKQVNVQGKQQIAKILGRKTEEEKKGPSGSSAKRSG
ncbi:hypothetical protein DFQ28_007475 [Apophysomyces sp. BC1034]|nr:hypothetical protein DFQ30_011019 [Apophysomyces sp. BC1015]KAG0181162.1 hypothetical protein DFQ29_009121 [Apophysomyces sp. BC1021]KAG0186680.1 hypothetical protein DFQ28_007475 [Apophysomyces sp. BC1034]